jgi:hypothetical protein
MLPLKHKNLYILRSGLEFISVSIKNIFPLLLVRVFDGMCVPDIAPGTIIGECETRHFFVK